MSAFPPREGRPPRRPQALLSDLAPSENMENWTAYFAPQQADPIPTHCRDAVPGVCIGPKPALCLRVNILHNLTALFRSNQLLRNLRLNSSALPTS